MQTLNAEQIKAIVNPLKESDYWVHVHLHNIKSTLIDYAEEAECRGTALELNPDFQRGHVWTEAQQIHYIENLYRGFAPNKIMFATGRWAYPNDHDDYMKNIYCLDGLQRLTAITRFMNGEIGIFDGRTYDDLKLVYHNRVRMEFHVYVIPTKAELLNLYINLNSGGTPHSSDEISRVRKMLSDIEELK